MRLPATWYIIIALFVVIILQRACKSTPSCPVTVKVDTVYKDVLKYVPNYVPKYVQVSKEIPSHVDTTAIISEFVSKNLYKDTIRNQYGYVLVTDTIYQNKISDRKVVFDFKVPTITLTNEIKPRNKIFIGLDLGSNGSFIGIGPQLTLLTKSDKMYWIGASFTSQNQLYYHAGLGWKIHF